MTKKYRSGPSSSHALYVVIKKMLDILGALLILYGSSATGKSCSINHYPENGCSDSSNNLSIHPNTRSLSCPCDSCWNPVESSRIIFGREPCQNCHSGDHLFQQNRAIPELTLEWSRNGPEWNPAECCFFFFFCMYDKVSIILTPLWDMHTSSGMFLSHKGVHRAQKWR